MREGECGLGGADEFGLLGEQAGAAGLQLAQLVGDGGEAGGGVHGAGLGSSRVT
jgi:hypothetical protein